MIKGTALLGGLFLTALLLIAACNGGEEAQPTPTPSPAIARLSPTPQPTPTPPLSPTLEPTAMPRTARIFSISTRQPMGSYLKNADGSGLAWIGGMLWIPEVDIWSPDGSKVAFVVCPERPILPAELYVMNSDGTGLTNVSNHPAHDVVKCQTDAPFGGFDWSPDGTRLVFHSSRDPRGLYVVKADGSGLAFLVDGVLPSWSPDGEMIAFIGQTDEANWEMDLEVIRPDGSGRMLLSRIPCFLSFLGASCQATRVRWSPGGTLLVFAANPAPPPAGPQLPESINSVYTLGADGSGLTRVTDSPGEHFAPIWVDCSRPTAGCEAKVTNVASEGLNVRQEPSKDASPVGKLGDGELVCFIGPSRFIDGFRWWPARSEAGIEGWSAAFDPDEPNEPWLTATGRTCQGEQPE